MDYYIIAGAVKQAAECFPEPHLRCSDTFSDYLTGIMLALLPEKERECVLEARVQQLQKAGDSFCTSLSAADRVREGCSTALEEGAENAVCHFSGKTVGDSTVKKAAKILLDIWQTA